MQEWVSLDGYASGVDDEGAIFAAVDETADARSQEHNLRLLEDATVLLGRRTYEQFVQYWPTATEAIAGSVNAASKVVASSTLSAAPWGSHEPATVVPDARRFVEEARRDGTGVLIVWGSLDLVAALVEHGLVDELDLFVAPVWVGEGTRLLPAGWSSRLRQLDSENWGSVTHLRYGIALD